MSTSQSVWVDGSLQDYDWYTQVLSDVRRRYPKYRVALIYVHASRENVLARAQSRGEQTGRFIPEETLLSSIDRTAKSVQVLSPLCDFVARIDNNGLTPILELVEDRTRSWERIEHTFGFAGRQELQFPYSLHPIVCCNDASLLEAIRCPAALQAQFEGGCVPQGDRHRLDLCSSDGSVRNELEISRISDIKLDEFAVRRLGLPTSARSFAWCHSNGPQLGFTQRTSGRSAIFRQSSARSCSFASGQSDMSGCGNVRNLISYHGFLYFDAMGNVCAARMCQAGKAHLIFDATEDASVYTFRDPEPLSKETAAALQSADRWLVPVFPRAAQSCADAMVWLPPSELSSAPFGAFAYRLCESPYASCRHVFYAMRAPD